MRNMAAPVVESVVESNMDDFSWIAGIVLAGGRSSRMGRNKALLDFKGRPLVRHMMDTLHDMGLKDVYVSGSIEGYPCIDDETPYEGPARGINNILLKKPDYRGYLFVPVDMPFLTAELLRELIMPDKGAYFTDWPLPLFLVRPIIISDSPSVHGLIQANSISPVAIPPTHRESMININTPQEWDRALSTS